MKIISDEHCTGYSHPGHPERPKVMDRLHAFGYFLEGLLPRASQPRCAVALAETVLACA
jgi:hypothetical protein